MKLSLIRNPRIVQKLAKSEEPKRMVWGKLAAPIYARDTQNKAVAVSFLRGLSMRDGEPTYCSDLSNAQAADLAAWIKGNK